MYALSDDVLGIMREMTTNFDKVNRDISFLRQTVTERERSHDGKVVGFTGTINRRDFDRMIETVDTLQEIVRSQQAMIFRLSNVLGELAMEHLDVDLSDSLPRPTADNPVKQL